MAISQRLEIVKQQMHSVRQYLYGMLDGLSEDDWFWSPQTPTTHILWQVGHIAMAQYGLTLFRQRARADIDSELMSGKARKVFMKGTVPVSDRTAYPDPNETLAILERVNQQMLREIDSFDGLQLDEPVDPPHVAFATRYGALLFASHHEILHIGQIGLLRRMMGKAPIR